MRKKMMKTAVFGFTLALLLSGCDEIDRVEEMLTEQQNISTQNINDAKAEVAQDDTLPFEGGAVTPFKRIAALYAVRDTHGDIDHAASEDKARQLAINLAIKIANVNEEKEDSANYSHGDWLVNGYMSDKNATGKTIAPHIVAIPTNATVDDVSMKRNMTYVVEMVNFQFAMIGLGLDNDINLPNGVYRSTVLPCSEVSVYYNPKDEVIYIDVLNAPGLVALFNSDLLSSNLVPSLVTQLDQLDKEVVHTVYNWMENSPNLVKAMGQDTSKEYYQEVSILAGPVYASKTMLETLPSKIGVPYEHFSYEATKDLTAEDIKEITEIVTQVMTVHGAANAGKQEKALYNQLESVKNGMNPGWRTARHEAFPLPGNIRIIEACSPPYAKMALSTGKHHSPALPCEIAFMVNPQNPKKLDVSFLNVKFMFGALFSDALADLSDEEKEAFKQVTVNIEKDLKTIIDYSMENNVSIIKGDTKEEIKPIKYIGVD